MSDLEIRAGKNGFRPGRRYFVLEDDNRTVRQTPVVCAADFLDWQKQTCGRYLVDRMIIGDKPEIIVTTHFLGYDDEPPNSPPKPWSTIVLGGPLHNRLWPYATLGEAKQGHWETVDLVRRAIT